MPSKEEVVEALRGVEDPELGMDIVELGLFYDAEIDGPNVKVTYTLTSMGCPAGQMSRRGRPRRCPTTPSSSWASGNGSGPGRVPHMGDPRLQEICIPCR